MPLDEIVRQPTEQRNPDWEEQLCHLLPTAKVRLLSDKAQHGPDGWPYFCVATSGNGNQTEEVFANIVDWVATRGIGIAINPQDESVDLLMSYGLAWYFKESRRLTPPSNSETSSADGKVRFGEPNPTVAPDYVRRVLRRLFNEQGHLAPRFSLAYRSNTDFDLIFSLESLGSPETSKHQALASEISWFLPPHYPIGLASEKDLPSFYAI